MSLRISVLFPKVVDMAVAGLTVTHQRSTVVDFSYPFWFEPSAVAVKVIE